MVATASLAAMPAVSSAEPANPVPFPMIIGAAMGAPNTVPGVLGVKVTAND